MNTKITILSLCAFNKVTMPPVSMGTDFARVWLPKGKMRVRMDLFIVQTENSQTPGGKSGILECGSGAKDTQVAASGIPETALFYGISWSGA